MACRRIAVHIGTHKTGTSAIQTGLQALKPALTADDWHYLDGGPNHSFLYLLFAEAPHTEHDMIKRGLGDPDDAAQWVAATRRKVADELRGVSSRNVLISGEELCRLSPAGAQRFVAFLKDIAPEVSVACFVRSPIGYCLSDAQEGIKGGLTLAEVTAHPPVARYRVQLEKYVVALGADNVHVLRYQPPAPDRPSGLRMLADAIGLPTALDEAAGRQMINESLSLEAAMILGELNARHPMYVDNAVNPQRAQLPMRWLRSLGSTPFSLPRVTLEKSLTAAHDDIAWLHSLTGEAWFYEEAIPADLPCDIASVGMSEQVAADVARVLNEAALLVQETMFTLLRDRRRHAERDGNSALVEKLDANLRLLKAGANGALISAG